MTEKEIMEGDVVQYLKDHSDFFIRNSDLLEVLEVKEKNGTVTSLTHHQINTFKKKNIQLKTKLHELISFAEENEKIMSQIFELTLQLCQISHVANVTKHFGRFIKQHFSPDLFKIVMPHYDHLNSSQNVLCVDEHKQLAFESAFGNFCQTGKTAAGRLKKDKLSFVFGRRAQEVGSSVMLPIGPHAEKGILVFASFDESRFNADVSTDLLKRLTHILERKFTKKFNFERTEENIS